MSALVPSVNTVIMTSREIAELTGKDHRHVLRDIRALKDQLGDMFNGSAQNWTHPQNGQVYEEFLLDKDTCLTLLLGYDPVARMKVVKRWQDLETAQGHKLPQTMAQALRLAAEQAERLERQQEQLALAAPKVAFVDRYVDATGLKGFREVAKLLKANEARFREFLIDSKIMYRLGGSLTAHQNHIDAGRFEVRTGVADSEHAFTTTKFTSKGVDWIAGEWAKYQLHVEHVS